MLTAPESIELTPISGTTNGAAGDQADRARRLHQLCDRHWTMFVLSILIVAAAFLLEVRDSQTVGPIGLPQFSLPALCGSRVLFGVDCPGCGLTRSFIALAGGNVAESIRFHRVGWVLALAVVLQIPYRLFCLWELRTKIPARTWPTWFGNLLIALLIGNWLLKVSGVF